MIQLFTQSEYELKKASETLPLRCLHCDNIFRVKKKYIREVLLKKTYKKYDFCSKSCNRKFNELSLNTSCTQCGKTFKRKLSQYNKSTNHFCSRSCSATFNNTHKTKGTRKSKLEKWLEEKLPTIYQNLEFHFNRKDAINSELDIYIPSLKLAFELNGIFHYEPIYGSEKFSQIQNNDERKFQACSEQGISLCVIDTSSLKNFKEHRAQKYLDIIKKIIDSRLSTS